MFPKISRLVFNLLIYQTLPVRRTARILQLVRRTPECSLSLVPLVRARWTEGSTPTSAVRIVPGLWTHRPAKWTTLIVSRSYYLIFIYFFYTKLSV